STWLYDGVNTWTSPTTTPGCCTPLGGTIENWGGTWNPTINKIWLGPSGGCADPCPSTDPNYFQVGKTYAIPTATYTRFPGYGCGQTAAQLWYGNRLYCFGGWSTTDMRDTDAANPATWTLTNPANEYQTWPTFFQGQAKETAFRSGVHRAGGYFITVADG